MLFVISCPEFRHENAIPSRFTCEGENVSPALHFAGIPTGTKSLALIVDDPDSPDPEAPERTFTHWLVYDLPPELLALEEGVQANQLPAGATRGKNDFGKLDWSGPCPKVGRHRYFFRLYALSRKLGDLGEPTRTQLDAAMHDHIIDQTVLMGTYRRG